MELASSHPPGAHNFEVDLPFFLSLALLQNNILKRRQFKSSSSTSWGHTATQVGLDSFLNLATDGSQWTASSPGRFKSEGRTPGVRWLTDWVGPRADRDNFEKGNISGFLIGIKTRVHVSHPQPSHSTDYLLRSTRLTFIFRRKIMTSLLYFPLFLPWLCLRRDEMTGCTS